MRTGFNFGRVGILALALGAFGPRPARAWVNPGFEQMPFGTGWNFSASASTTNTVNAPEAGIAAAGPAPYTNAGQLSMAHGGSYAGGIFSGNGDSNHGDWASISQSDTVPAGTSCLTGYFAAVLSGWHDINNQPYGSDAYVLFQVVVGGVTVYSQRFSWYDNAAQLMDPGAPYDQYYWSSFYNAYISDDNGPWKYLPWTQYYFDLSAYVGQTATIIYSAYSCDEVQHYSYGFLDDVAWAACPPTPTDSTTATPTGSPTLTATPSASPPNTATASTTATGSATPTSSPTGTTTASPSWSPTLTATPSASPTGSITPTSSPTDSPTDTFSATLSYTATPSASQTCTNTPTSSATGSATPSATASASPSYTPTATASSTASSSPTVTPTYSATPTASPSFTATPSGTPSATASASGSFTPTSSFTGTFTATQTFTATATATASRTRTFTSTDTPTATATPTRSPSATATESFTASPTGSVTPSPSATPTASPTSTDSGTASPTFSITPTGTPSGSYYVTLKVFNSAGELVDVVSSLKLYQPPLGLSAVEAAFCPDQGQQGQAVILGSGIVVDWDGKNNAGQLVGSGSYLLQLSYVDPFGRNEDFDAEVAVLRQDAEIHIQIYNAAGELVREEDEASSGALAPALGGNSLIPGQGLKITLGPAGEAWTWDGTNAQGRPVQSGVYLVKISGINGQGNSQVFVFSLAVLNPLPRDLNSAFAAPNPVRQGQGLVVFLAAPGADFDPATKVEARFFDLAGEAVGRAINGPDPGRIEFETRGLAPGIYLACLRKEGQGEAGQVKTLKFAVMP